MPKWDVETQLKLIFDFYTYFSLGGAGDGEEEGQNMHHYPRVVGVEHHLIVLILLWNAFIGFTKVKKALKGKAIENKKMRLKSCFTLNIIDMY